MDCQVSHAFVQVSETDGFNDNFLRDAARGKRRQRRRWRICVVVTFSVSSTSSSTSSASADLRNDNGESICHQTNHARTRDAAKVNDAETSSAKLFLWVVVRMQERGSANEEVLLLLLLLLLLS